MKFILLSISALILTLLVAEINSQIIGNDIEKGKLGIGVNYRETHFRYKNISFLYKYNLSVAIRYGILDYLTMAVEGNAWQAKNDVFRSYCNNYFVGGGVIAKIYKVAQADLLAALNVTRHAVIYDDRFDFEQSYLDVCGELRVKYNFYLNNGRFSLFMSPTFMYDEYFQHQTVDHTFKSIDNYGVHSGFEVIYCQHAWMTMGILYSGKVQTKIGIGYIL